MFKFKNKCLTHAHTYKKTTKKTKQAGRIAKVNFPKHAKMRQLAANAITQFSPFMLAF